MMLSTVRPLQSCNESYRVKTGATDSSDTLADATVRTSVPLYRLSRKMMAKVINIGRVSLEG